MLRVKWNDAMLKQYPPLPLGPRSRVGWRMIEISQLAGRTKSTPIVLELFFGVSGAKTLQPKVLYSVRIHQLKKTAAIYACSNVIDHPEFFNLGDTEERGEFSRVIYPSVLPSAGILLRTLTARVPQMGFPPNFCSISVLQNFTGASLAGGFKTVQNESLGIIKVLWLNKNMLKPTTRSTIL